MTTKRNITDPEAAVYYAALEAQFSRSFLCDNKAPTCIDDEVATVNLAVKLNDYINSYKSKETKSPELMKKHAINIYSHVFVKKQSHDGGSILNLFGGGDSELTTLSSPTQYGGGFNLLGGGNEKPEIYLFKADWCPHCTGFKPTWEKLAKNLKSKYNFFTFDADKDGEKIKKWNIKGFPTIIKKVGNNMEEYVGPRDEISVKEFIEAN
jgi:thiol-disulfide isomerase/thioredoxin